MVTTRIIFTLGDTATRLPVNNFETYDKQPKKYYEPLIGKFEKEFEKDGN